MLRVSRLRPLSLYYVGWGCNACVSLSDGDDPAVSGPSCGPQFADTPSFTYSSDRVKALSMQPYHSPRATRRVLLTSSSVKCGDLGQDVLFWGDDWQARCLPRSQHLPSHRPLLLHRPQTVF